MDNEEKREQEQIEQLSDVIDYIEFQKMGEKTTVCLIKLNNGFEVVGTSACVNPEDFSKEIGEEISCGEAIRKIQEYYSFLKHEAN